MQLHDEENQIEYLGEKSEEEEFETFNNLLDDNQDQVSSLSSDSYEGGSSIFIMGYKQISEIIEENQVL